MTGISNVKKQVGKRQGRDGGTGRYSGTLDGSEVTGLRARLSQEIRMNLI